MHSAKNLIITISVTFIIYLTIFAFSKIVRGLFRPPEILDNKIIGFAHYYGHSFYFDYIFLLAIIFNPIIVIIVLKAIFKKYDKKDI